MTEYSVEITSKELGIEFDIPNNNNENIISYVRENSVGDKLGICVGDHLIAINNVSIFDVIKSSQYSRNDLSYIMSNQPIPFTAIFKKPDIESVISPVHNNYEFIQNVIYNINIMECSDTESESTPFDNAHLESMDTFSHEEQIAAYHQIVRTARTLSNVNECVKTVDNKCNNETDGQNVSQSMNCCSYIIQPKLKHFDKTIVTTSNNKKCLVGSHGLMDGYHEWIVKVVKCDIYSQEIGVIGTAEIENMNIHDNGIKASDEFAARAIYGSELCTDSVYYASYNEDGTRRCYRDLTKKHHIQWSSGDTIKVCVDLRKWSIKFLLNNKKVRKPMSVQKNKIYYPFISFGGDSMYELISFE